MANDVFKKNDIVYSDEVNGRTLVLNIESGRFYNLTGVSLLIWQLLETPSTVNEVAEGVAKECDVAVSECLDDVAAFMGSLYASKLIAKAAEV